MADVWELICHHTYAGVPGIIADVSGCGSYGQAAGGLNDADFLRDGAGVGSGSVRLYGPTARVQVSDGKWGPLGGVRGEVTLRLVPPVLDIRTILYSDSFHFFMRGGGNLVAWFAGDPLSYAEVSVHNDQVGPQHYVVPGNHWVTLGFMHDGINTMEIYADGVVVARKTGPVARVRSLLGDLSIGATPVGDPLIGEIDEVKIWRLNPHRVDEEFLDRPMDSATIECYRKFFAELQDALERHPECAASLGLGTQRSVTTLLQEASGKGPETRERIERTAGRYRELWQAGRIDSPEMEAQLSDLLTWLRLAGVDPGDNAALNQLADSSCWQLLLREVTPPDCDTQLRELIRRLGNSDTRVGTS